MGKIQVVLAFLWVLYRLALLTIVKHLMFSSVLGVSQGGNWVLQWEAGRHCPLHTAMAAGTGPLGLPQGGAGLSGWASGIPSDKFYLCYQSRDWELVV